MKKSKEFDNFSFKKIQSEPQSFESIPESLKQKHSYNRQPYRKMQINYRHENNHEKAFNKKSYYDQQLQSSSGVRRNIFNTSINNKIDKISQDLEENIRRRIELEQKLKKQQLITQIEVQANMTRSNQINYKDKSEEIENYVKISKKVDQIDRKIVLSRQQPYQIIDYESKKGVLLDIEESIEQKQSKNHQFKQVNKISKKNKQIALYTLPNQLRLQKLIQKVTFPQFPKQNLQKLRRQCDQLYAIHAPHSDINLLLMIIYYHLKKYNKVRKHFQQILTFKQFNKIAFWIASETQFESENYSTVIKLTEECLQMLPEKILPRLLYLKGKCYFEEGNLMNSILCYNQLIKIRPQIAEYYLERSISYDKIGYYKESKEDYIMFGVLKPSAKQYLQEKVLCEKNETRRKNYLAILTKIY